MESVLASNKSKIKSMRDDKLRSWLSNQINDLSHREVARRLGVSHTKVSRFLSEQDLAGFEFSIAIARYYKRNPLTILSWAGLIPPVSENDASMDEVIQIMRELDEPSRQLVLNAVRGLYQGFQQDQSLDDT